MLTCELEGYTYLGDGRYQSHNQPHVVINTKYTVETEEENQAILKKVARSVYMGLLKQELQKRGKTLEDLK